MMATDKKLSWTQPVCVACWGGIKVKTGRAADAGQVLEQELCCFCNAALQGGRYQIRINPATVPYPTRK